jgi:hypothetical protein
LSIRGEMPRMLRDWEIENIPLFRGEIPSKYFAIFDAFLLRWLGRQWLEISCLDHLSLPCKIATTVCKLSEKIKDLKMFQSFYWEI